MDARKAIDRIHAFMLYGGETTLKARDLAIMALEKQVPKKPLEETKFYGNGKCPTCGAVFMDKSTKYCGNCGQALDWEE